MAARKPKSPAQSGVGMPATAMLNSWGADLYRAFGQTAYMVGSATQGKSWRDVDVRMILDDDDYDRLCGPKVNPDFTNARWAALVTSISLWGKAVTGLPIDFQFQRRDKVMQEDWDKPRVPLGIFVQDYD